jgi:hypothetical protein
MSIMGNETGVGKVKLMIVLVLLGAGIHVGYKVLDVYMDYERMKDTMSTKAGVAQVLKDDEITKDLVNKAKELDLPLRAENFVLIRDGERRKMTIKTAWDVEVHFFGDLYIHTYHFAPVVEENIMSR